MIKPYLIRILHHHHHLWIQAAAEAGSGPIEAYTEPGRRQRKKKKRGGILRSRKCAPLGDYDRRIHSIPLVRTMLLMSMWIQAAAEAGSGPVKACTEPGRRQRKKKKGGGILRSRKCAPLGDYDRRIYKITPWILSVLVSVCVMAINISHYESTGRGYFSVEVTSREMIRPELPLPEFWLPLSNLDLIVPPIDASIYFIYRNIDASDRQLSFGERVRILKESLSRVLVPYYPLAGEVVANSMGEPELLCNNRGVDFVETHADIELDQMKPCDPDETVRGKLVPAKIAGVLCVQVTELKCGGVVVACVIDHRAGDAYSKNMFMASWSEIARTGSTTLVPNFRKSLLSPRRPGSYDKSMENLYTPLRSSSELSNSNSNAPLCSDQLVNRVYHVSASDLDRLQALASNNNGNTTKMTKLETFSAYLWKLTAGASVDDSKICSLGIVVDGRSRLGDDGEEWGPSSKLYGYFGNVVSIPMVEERAEDLKREPLAWAAGKVHELLVGSKTKEHFRDVIDYVEAQRPSAQPLVTTLHHGGEGEGPAIVVSHGKVFGVKGVDFGWGDPFWGSVYFPWAGDGRFALIMPSPLGNGDWIVYVHLLKEQVEEIEGKQDGVVVFRPVTIQLLTVAP